MTDVLRFRRNLWKPCTILLVILTYGIFNLIMIEERITKHTPGHAHAVSVVFKRHVIVHLDEQTNGSKFRDKVPSSVVMVSFGKENKSNSEFKQTFKMTTADIRKKSILEMIHTNGQIDLNYKRKTLSNSLSSVTISALQVKAQQHHTETTKLRENTNLQNIFNWCDHLSFEYPSEHFVGFVKTFGKENHGLQPLYVHEFEFTINAFDACTDKDKIWILSVVKSKATNFQLRNVIRKTWGKRANGGNNKLVFLLGFSKESIVRKKTVRESRIFRDIIQQDFLDNYYNNSYKSIMAIRWIHKFCSKTKFVFFVDDDMLINYEKVVQFYKNVSMEEENSLFSGYLHKKPKPVRLKEDKWYISKIDYPYECYPQFLSGGAILTSGSVVKLLNFAIPYVKAFKFDDVYFGLILQKVGIKPQMNELINMRSWRRIDISKFIAIHGFNNHKLYIRIHRKFIAGSNNSNRDLTK